MKKHLVWQTAVFLLTILLLSPSTVHAHAADAPPELIKTLADQQKSGPFVMTVSQYATADFTEVAVLLQTPDGQIIPTGHITLKATAPQTGQTFQTTLAQHHDEHYLAQLPLGHGVWQVEILAEGENGRGSLFVAVTPYTPPAPSSPIVQAITIGVPFGLMILLMLIFKRLNISIFSAPAAPPRRPTAQTN
ncbi:MAG: hypothetical protein AAF490_10610 [Chloroflexota bacterium]